MKCLAIIPARSGSKGIKNKNIKKLCGKPLLAYTIEAALKSKVFDEVMVSTDSIKYASIAKKYGANVPFLRSKKNSSDKSTTYDTVVEVLKEYEKRKEYFDCICILQPTSPLRTSKNIIEAYKIFCKKAIVAVVSVCEVENNPLLCNVLQTDNSIDGFIKKKYLNKRRQDFNKYYRINGAIYFIKTKEYLNNNSFYRKGSYAYIMGKYNSVDIDTIDDFYYVEYVLKHIKCFRKEKNI